MNNKEYGVKLNLNTSDFQKKLQDMKDKITDFTKKAKRSFELGFKSNYDITDLYDLADQYEEQLKQVQDNLSKTGIPKSVKENLEKEAQELEDDLGKVAKATEVLENPFKNAINFFFDLGQHIRDIKEGSLKPYIETEEEAEEETKDFGEKTKVNIGIFQNFDGSLKKAVSSIKRFSLSLLGIQSLYSALTKATNAYMSTDETLHNKIQASWIALGATMAPIIEKLIELFQRFVGYVNVFYRAFTGKDLISKALKNVEKQTNKNTKAQKELNKELANFDEITNLNMNNGNNNDETSGVPSIEDYLKEMQEMKLNPEIVKVLTWLAEKLKDLWNWAKKNKDILIEVGKVIAIAFAVGKVVSFIKKLKKVFDVVGLIGGSSGFGLWALVIAGIVVDLKLAYDLYQKILELNDANNEKKKSEEELTNSELKTMNTALSVLEDTTKNETQKANALEGAEQTYRQYLTRLKEGHKYTKEQKEEMEEYVKNIEKISGKTFKTKIEAEIDGRLSGSSKKFWEDFINHLRIGNSGNQYSAGGGRHFAKGNVAYEPTVAEFGEYAGASSNPEITAPQNMMRQTLFEALSQALPLVNTGSGQEHGDIVLNVNGKEFARATYGDYQSEARRMGSSSVAIRRS